jgi:phenol hydroxylase P5 protein
LSYTLTIEPLGEEVQVEEGQTILDACLRSGVWLPHACGHGRCGSCKVDVVDGEVDHAEASSFALMDFERDEGKTLACTAKLMSDVTIEADIEEDPDARRIKVRDYAARVVRIDSLTHDVKGIHLALDAPMDFQAGQYINLHVPGIAEPRAFSLASAPAQGDRIELHVRLVPGGQATTYLHNSLMEGDTLKVSGPYGRFFVRKSAQLPMLFLAGGTGLSSPKSMIVDLLGEGCRLPMTLVHGVRSLRDLYDDQTFLDLARRHDNLTYIPVLSEAKPEDNWTGETGFVHEAALRAFGGTFEGLKAYLCGPPPMIEACIRALMQGRLFERDIYTEKFLTAADSGEGRVKSPVFRRL